MTTAISLGESSLHSNTLIPLSIKKQEDCTSNGPTLSTLKDNLYEGGLKSKFRFVITFLFFIVHT